MAQQVKDITVFMTELKGFLGPSYEVSDFQMINTPEGYIFRCIAKGPGKPVYLSCLLGDQNLDQNTQRDLAQDAGWNVRSYTMRRDRPGKKFGTVIYLLNKDEDSIECYRV